MNFRSTFSQIIWLQVLAIATTSLAMPVGIFLFLDSTVTNYQVAMLRQHEQGLARALAASSSGPVLPPEIQAPYAQGVGGFAYAVLDGSGQVLSSSPGAQALAPAPTGRSVRVFRHRSGAVSYFGASFPETFQSRPIWVQVGQNLENPDVVMDDVLARFIPEVAVLSGVLLTLLLAADIVIVRRALKPILRASELAGAISPSRIDLRLPMGQMPREISPLIQAVNEAFDRLERGFRAQRDLTADVAHELRTPLAVLRMRADAVPDLQTRATLMADIDRMGRIVSQLLAIAELENVVIAPSDRADLRQVCLEVITHLAPLAVDEDKRIELKGPRGAAWVRGHHDFLFQAVRNLVENAMAHAPKGSVVTVEASPDGTVRVLDRGPGVSPEQRERLFQRFWRQRRERSSAGAGAGLGLSIVARIAESHGGQVLVEDRPGGGAVFVLAIAPASEPPA